MSEFNLTREILALSQSVAWDEAKREWTLHNIYEADEFETCLCGHYPIKEICVLQNKKNLNKATVGNCCVKKFIGLPSDLIFQAVKRVRKDEGKSLNFEAITHAYSKGWINEWEYKFSIDTMRKRNLSGNQLQKRMQVNAKMLNNMKRNPSA
ncbi:hypothetical protein [Pseudomonas sp. BIC9C]|uniref:hypothetical protein n=1 Tax=Pseudomonas sp. BIC9C TaxID=3078458 RepID=UPI002AD3AD03|nr:hypothetical protein [Pseudomonas sp. BIC9C]